MLLAACAPTATPDTHPPLSDAAIITPNRYQNDAFSVVYPAGWRVITSPAGAAPGVTFVAPGNCTLIAVASAPFAQPPSAPACDQPISQTAEQITQGERTIYLSGSAPESEWNAMIDAIRLITGSLEAAE